MCEERRNRTLMTDQDIFKCRDDTFEVNLGKLFDIAHADILEKL